jgi:signal transduction histidine kinase
MTMALLAGVVIPLGIASARHNRQVFVDRADETAATVADRVEERLADHPGSNPALALGTTAENLRVSPGDQIAVYDAAGRVLQATSPAALLSPAERASALRGATVRRWRDDPDQLTVVKPVRAEGRAAGLAVVMRPSGALSRQQATLWWSLSGAAVLALGLAVVLAIVLARWVSRPLHRLEAAAAGLGSEHLNSRADTASGPAEVRQLAATFNRMAGRLEALVAAQRSVIADVSHQLRTPLAALRLRLELLRQDVDDSAGTEIDGALAEATRLSRLLDGLLAVARAENTEPAPQPVDLYTVATQRIDAWTPVATEAGLDLFLDSAPDGGPLVAMSTPGTPEQVLDNLLANAMDATPAHGRITVSIRKTQGMVCLTVADTGPGMTGAERDAAPRRYWSGDSERSTNGQRTDRQGSGLGLAIVDRLLTADGGTLQLQEATGGGLAAVVDLPAADCPESESSQ